MAHEILSVKMYELDKNWNRPTVGFSWRRVWMRKDSTNRSRIFDRRKPYHFGKQTSPFQERLSVKLAGVYDQVEQHGKVLEAENINLKNKEPIFGNVPGTEEKNLAPLILQCRQ